MKFIEAEEFLKQDERIQKVFIDWWKPSIGDLFTTKRVYDEIDVIIDVTKEDIWGMNNTFKGNIYSSVDKSLMVFPLLTEGQLRQFIEDKFSGDVKVELEWSNDGYIVNVVSEINDEKVYEEYYSYESEPIKAYWYAVLQITKEEV